jgi:hypothetical protein
LVKSYAGTAAQKTSGGITRRIYIYIYIYIYMSALSLDDMEPLKYFSKESGYDLP